MERWRGAISATESYAAKDSRVSEVKDGRKRARKPRKKHGYVPRSNAIHVTLYDPSGRPLKPEIADQAAETITQFALENKLLIGLART